MKNGTVQSPQSLSSLSKTAWSSWTTSSAALYSGNFSICTKIVGESATTDLSGNFGSIILSSDSIGPQLENES